MRKDLPVEETHIYPEGINLDEYTDMMLKRFIRINSGLMKVIKS